MPRLESLRARAGAKLLDILSPGWADKIDLTALDLSNCQVCVLGQLFGGYEAGCRRIFAIGVDNASFVSTLKPAKQFGFTLSARRGNFSRLTAAWKREITRRQKSSLRLAA